MTVIRNTLSSFRGVPIGTTPYFFTTTREGWLTGITLCYPVGCGTSITVERISVETNDGYEAVLETENGSNGISGDNQFIYIPCLVKMEANKQIRVDTIVGAAGHTFGVMAHFDFRR